MATNPPTIVEMSPRIVAEGTTTLYFQVENFLDHLGAAYLASSNSGAQFSDETAVLQKAAAGSGGSDYVVVTATVSYPSSYSGSGDITIIIDTYDDPTKPRSVTKTFGTSRPKITYLRDSIEGVERISKPKPNRRRSPAKKQPGHKGKK